MSGGRLTAQERRRIAAGLADRLAYAEIARRVERPTSTITREVTRNGGPAGYRADLAQRAAERRAHRRRPGRIEAPEPDRQPPDRQPPGRDAGILAGYEESFATALMASGLPRMPARVLTCLFTSDEGCRTASQLARHLRVSPASVSKAIAFLESQTLVRRERDERRRDRYVVDDGLFYQATIATVRANDRVLETARHGVTVLGPESPAGVRLERIARFLELLGEGIGKAAEQARDALEAEPGVGGSG